MREEVVKILNLMTAPVPITKKKEWCMPHTASDVLAITYAYAARQMQSLIISWAVCARLAMINKKIGANVLAVGTVICDTSIIPVPAGTRN